MAVKNKVDLKQRLYEVAEKNPPYDLPIAVYLVTKDGEFVDCNPRAREILKLPPTGKEIKANIKDFFCDPYERIRLLKELEEAEAEGRFLEKKVVRFKVNGEKIWVQDYCRSVKDPETGEIIGYTGCLVDVTEEESSRQLFEKLPIGIYTLDTENRIVRVNKASADMLGYNHPSEVEGTPIENHYADKEKAEEFENLIKEKGSVVNEIVELVKKTNEYCYFSVCSYKKTDTDGTYIGREGTIMDVTEEENYRQLRDSIPVGTYMVRKDTNGNEIIQQCNKTFANMFESEIEELKGKEVNELYVSEKEYKDFVKEITEKHRRNEIMGRIPVRVKTSKGRILTLEVHCRLLTDKSGRIMGRAGIVLDISNEVALHELRDDIGRVLHFYSATLVNLEQSIKPIISALAPDPFTSGEVLTIDKAIEALTEPTKNLKNILSKMIEFTKVEPGRRSAIPEEKWAILKNHKQLLEEYETQILYPEFQVATLHEVSRIILDVHGKIEKGKLPRELTRDLYNKAKELERICCLIRTHQTLDTIIEVDYTIRALREFVFFQQRQPGPGSIFKITKLIQNAIYQLYLFARHRRVAIKQDHESCKARVKVEERSVLRALSNLLYNAFKYSWHRRIEEKTWVNVRAFAVRDKVHVEFQSFGVPITKEEIEKELIFNFGYRGKYSGDRMRLGTGIGLSDARDTARKYGGDVKITSRPASGEDETNYKQPFITTATFILPIYA
ncbi:MAG: PAS domain-containing protein [Candidatus Aminicenantes bacterium]|nr:PAS domain-containing protein [Candidatus Aminicenantes bacterium]